MEALERTNPFDATLRCINLRFGSGALPTQGMISIQHQFLFVHVPKTAGNAVQNILRAYSEDEIVCNEHQDGVERFSVRSKFFGTRKHSTLAVYRRECGEALYQRLFRFACVRNPWQRAISFYFSPHLGRSTWDRTEFIEFVGRIKPLAHFLSTHEAEAQPLTEAVHNVDFLMRFESLEQDFRAVCERIGISPQPLPVRNRSHRQPYQHYYDAQTRDLVAARFQEEIELFGYEFDPPRPGKAQATTGAADAASVPASGLSVPGS